MNGRVYDPTLGRFLSADPNVQAPDDTQSFNRYSYVKNNPLSYTDPSGFFFKKIFKKIKKLFSKLIKFHVDRFKKLLRNQYVTTAIQIGLSFVPGVGVYLAAAFSGIVTLVNGGSIGDALLTAYISLVTAQALKAINSVPGFKNPQFLSPKHVAKTLAHGVVGGVRTLARGGKITAKRIATGFLTSAFSTGLKGWKTTEWNLQEPGHVFEADVDKAVRHWDQIIAKTIIEGAAGAAIAKLKGDRVGLGTATYALSGLAGEIWRAYVPEKAQPLKAFGSGGPAQAKREGEILHGGNVFGIDPPRDGDPGFLTEGEWFSRVMDGYVPGMSAISQVHDVWARIWDKPGGICESSICVTTMVPAAAVTYGALYRDHRDRFE